MYKLPIIIFACLVSTCIFDTGGVRTTDRGVVDAPTAMDLERNNDGSTVGDGRPRDAAKPRPDLSPADQRPPRDKGRDTVKLDAPPPCPMPPCTACDTSTLTCTIDHWTDKGAVVCPEDWHCEVRCTDGDDCKDGIDCSGALSCDIECGADGDNTCKQGDITCGTGPCNIDCDGKKSCQGAIDCGQSCGCSVTCSGEQACDGAKIECPTAQTCCQDIPAGGGCHCPPLL